jgi:cyclase
MLKKRVIPVLLLKNKRMVKGKKFKNYIDTGDPVSCLRIYNAQYVDELIFININKNRFYSNELFSILTIASKNCFIPLTVGGGINSLKKIQKLLDAGADKVVINSKNYPNTSLLSKAAKTFGSQAIIAGIDIKKVNNKYFIYSELGKKLQNINLFTHIKNCEISGAGEFFFNFIHKDGQMDGYDIPIIKKISKFTNLPIIACGGAGNFKHIEDLLANTNATGAACASIFHFADNNPIRISSYLKNKGIPQKKY